MKRREFLKATGATLAAATFSDTLSAAPPRPPLNVLWFTVDDMNWSMPGFMGSEQAALNLTPNLDRLAASSHRFLHNRTTAPICQPSREAMMSGLIPHHSGALGFNPLHDGTPTLATVCKQHGYYLGGVHKLEHYKPDTSFPWDMAHPGTDRLPAQYLDGVKEAIVAAKAAGKPFLISCNDNDPHRPYYGSELAADMDHHETGPYAVAHPLQPEDVHVPSVLEPIPAVRLEWAQYCNNVQRLDVTLGKVLQVLVDEGVAGNTLILFNADHGMSFPFAKATVYDNGTRTPALLSWPGMGKPQVFEELTCNIDQFPTVLDILGLPKPPNLDGQSWLPLIQGKGKLVDRDFLVTHVNTVSSGAAYPMRCLQNSQYALIFEPWADGKLERHVDAMQGITFKAMDEAGKTDPRIAARVRQFLFGVQIAFYDLHTDPDQRHNLIDDPAHKAQIDLMKQRLLVYMQTTGDPLLDNFKTLLGGGSPVVIQPKRKHQKDVENL
jgi:N-sulfoglucosamine sulfohydrolase